MLERLHVEDLLLMKASAPQRRTQTSTQPETYHRDQRILRLMGADVHVPTERDRLKQKEQRLRLLVETYEQLSRGKIKSKTELLNRRYHLECGT